ncbi:anthranilate phosphoribosyltransferase [Raineyella antarctica]|uniref:Anthranilate phosphoribosyltransferase n=1 Tax=Raineyella antarctica TaxID=1577474 RepID=A0A1G6GEE7_9ACTN|nr:anthranilate phosphoribosyltransferase [Raineyella antarctica]SDB80125.1 anthranilate phosphoribosyltransferase [Raineyella antarctica]
MTARSQTWPDVLTGLVKGQDMTPEVTRWAMGEILSGNASPVQIAGFAVALSAKGETVDEVAGLAEVMLEFARPVHVDTRAVDVVGSGGDRANTVNISTMSAIVAAAGGAKVVKHGNRAASSMCGTADCLEALGLVLDLAPEKQQQVMDEEGIVFLFAPMYHGSLKHAAAPRRELGIATIFNYLGPLSNPARPQAQAIGIANERMAGLIAGVLAKRGNQGMVFFGGDGLDELTTTTSSRLWLINGGRVVATSLDPLDLGIARAQKSDLVGGDPSVNAAIVRETFAGKPGPVRDIVLLNAAATMLAYDGPDLDADATEQFRVYVDRARETIDSGRALARLDSWIAATQRLASA